MRIIGYTCRAGEKPKKYGVVLFDIIGNPVQDRQRCARTIKDAHTVALLDMKTSPLSCAVIYKVVKHKAVPVRNVNCAGGLEKPEEE